MTQTISILAGGWSAAPVARTRLPGLVLGINDAAILAPVDVGLSMDRHWTENRWHRLAEIGRETWIRRSAAKNIVAGALVAGAFVTEARPDWLHIFGCDNEAVELSADPLWLNGTNSGLCGLNWAYQRLRDDGGRIILFGFDMCRGPNGETYWWKYSYPWAREGGGTGNTRYAEWAAQFARAAAQCREARIEVINASTVSQIKAFSKADPREALTQYGLGTPAVQQSSG